MIGCGCTNSATLPIGPMGPSGPTWNISTVDFDTDGEFTITTSQPASASSTVKAWLTTGNSGINASTDFIGSTNNADLVFVSNNNSVGKFLALNGNFGVGVVTPLAKAHFLSTTEQLRLSYDNSNYMSTTVSSSGLVTLDAVGASAGFNFNDKINKRDPQLDKAIEEVLKQLK